MLVEWLRQQRLQGRVWIAAAALAVILAGCSGGQSSLGPQGGTATSNATGTAASSGTAKSTITIAYKDDLATLDPAIGYDWTNWPAEKMVFDGLLDYDSTTNLAPRVAASMPTVGGGGKVYTFTLRKGVRFQNGREVTAEDVAYSITRVLDPKTKSPGSGFYTGIAGAQAFIDGKASSVSGIQVLDRYTIRFVLTSPDVTFPNKMALNFAFVVPKEEVAKYGADFGHHPVGTGPFRLVKWTPGQQLVFEKNPEYFLPGIPKADRVVIQVGVDPTVALLRLQKGDIDIMGDPVPTSELAGMLQDPAWKSRITVAPQVSTIYVAINTRVKPFTDVRVRQALNMAIDKERIVKLLAGQGTVANQILPPLMPGYDKSYEGYPHDPKQAKRLLAEAGYPDGFNTTMECLDVDPQPKLCQSIQADLAQIGVKVDLKTLEASTIIADAGTPGKVPLVWSGGLAWIQDYPDPSDFYGPILGCSSAVQGGWNWAWYCNRDLEAKANQALGILDRTQRLAVYRQIFRKLMDEAVWVPVYNGQYVIAHSDRVVGDVHDFAHPEHTIFYELLAKKD